jgi:type I restriction enzyme, S subunit
MATYETIPLREVCRVTAGPYSALLENLHDGPDGVPVVAPSDITDEHGIDPRRVRRVPWDDAGKLSRFELRQGDVLYVRQGALGRLALVTAEQSGWFYNPSLLRLRPRDAVMLPAYLVAFLAYEPTRNTVLGQAQQGTVPSLNVTQFQELGVIVPPMRQQHAIAETIADIESNIKIHRAIADRLGAFSEAVFSDMVQGREPA